jgi:hypothetical protein
MELCRGLVAHKVAINAQSPLRPDGAARVLGGLHDDAGPFRDSQGAVDVTESREKNVQAGEKAQLTCAALAGFRKRKPTLDRGTNLIAVASGVHRRQRQGFLTYHLLFGV